MTFATDTSSLGFRIGRAIGATGAHITRRAEFAAENGSDFSRNLVAGTKAGYTSTSDRLLADRIAALQRKLSPAAQPAAAEAAPVLAAEPVRPSVEPDAPRRRRASPVKAG